MNRQPNRDVVVQEDRVVTETIDSEKGLSLAQVQERIENGQSNKVIDNHSRSYLTIFRENTFTYFNLIFLILACLLVTVHSYKNLTFMGVVIINIFIGVIQEIRAKKIVDNLTVLTKTTATVIRDAQKIEVDVEDLVKDDIVILQAGNQIMADARVVKGTIQVNESLLTGESDEITKKWNDQLLSGSFVISGTCQAQLEKVGAESYITKLTKQAKQIKTNEESKMVRSINKFIKWVGILIVPVGFILFSQSFFINKESLEHSIVTMVAALIGMIPEGLYLLTTVSLAMGASRLAKQKVLLHNMKSIETLARVDVLCVDKTGTITENKMEVEELVALKNPVFTENEIKQALADFASAMTADNDTIKAIKQTFQNQSKRTVQSFLSFSSVEKFSSVTFQEETFVLGAPEVILKEQYVQYSEQIKQYAKKGLRVLIFAKYDGELRNRILVNDCYPLALLILSNPIRPHAKQTFQYFEEQGVAVKVISGDNPLTVSYTASKAGIKDAEHYIDARTLTDTMSIEQALKNYTVFGRVTPEQKEKIVDGLKNMGKTVAMTGDGVNDILAMKKADCSIAMASGNDATMKAAQVVLLESDFSKMPEVVLEGRQIVNNIERSASLFLVKNIFSLLMALFAIALSVTYPLNPLQITLISLFTIGIPSFLLTLEKNNKKIEGHFMTNVLSKSAPGGITDMFVVGILVICGYLFKVSSADISTTAALLLIVVGFFVLYKLSIPMNPFRRRVLYTSLLGMILTSLYFSKLFSLTRISLTSLFLLVILFFVANSVFQSLTVLTEKFTIYSQHLDRKKMKNPKYFWQTVKQFYKDHKKESVK